MEGLVVTQVYLPRNYKSFFENVAREEKKAIDCLPLLLLLSIPAQCFLSSL